MLWPAWRWLERFRSIILCFDSDKSGHEGLAKAFPKLIGRLGRHRCRIARMPEGVKDPNDAIQKGRLNDLVAALNAAESIDPEPLKPASYYEDRACDLLFPPDGKIVGIPLPWTDKLRLRPGEVTLWTGINSHGKSTALLHCLAHLTQAHGGRAEMGRVEMLLRQQWSPEQVAGHLRRAGEFSISHETIYRHVWRDLRQGGRLHVQMRGARKQRRKRYGRYDSQGRNRSVGRFPRCPAWCGHRPRHPSYLRARRRAWNFLAGSLPAKSSGG